MSIIFCKHCDQKIDTDIDTDHEETCELRPCEICNGEGVVQCDEWDEDSKKYQRGVGDKPCECQRLIY